MYKLLCAAVLATALAGCATQKVDPFVACVNAVDAKPIYNPLRTKMSLTGSDTQTVAMLASKEFASAEDKPLILLWADDRQACLKSDEATRSKMHPSVRNLFSMSSSMTTTAISQLYGGEITYGEFAQRRQKITDALRSDLSSIQSNAIAQDEANRRQVLLMQLQNQFNKPAPAAAPQPYMIPTQPTVTTNCTTVGGQVNCVSR